jgi:hypothetical protein
VGVTIVRCQALVAVSKYCMDRTEGLVYTSCTIKPVDVAVLGMTMVCIRAWRMVVPDL